MDLVYIMEKINHYIATGEIGSHLSLHAALAMQSAKSQWKRIRPEVAAFDRANFDVLSKIAGEVQDMHFKMKEFEFKHWMGFCDQDVVDLLRLKRKWEFFDWDNGSEAEAESLRALWAPHPSGNDWENYWKPAWQPYLDRRDKKPLKDVCLEISPCSATTEHLKVMMASTAGRVLITVQDRYERTDERSKFGGAWVTMIFDESAGYPRGGIQGHCATRDEGVGLIQAVIDDMPTLKTDKKVGIGF